MDEKIISISKRIAVLEDIIFLKGIVKGKELLKARKSEITELLNEVNELSMANSFNERLVKLLNVIKE